MTLIFAELKKLFYICVMNTFSRKITACTSTEIIPTIAGMCDRMDVTAYLFRYLDNGSVFIFVSFDGRELTAVTFGYDNPAMQNSLERQFIVITTLETKEVFRVSEATRGEFESIEGVAALPYFQATDTRFKERAHIRCLSYSYNIPGETSREKSDFLTSLFHAQRAKQSYSPFNNL